ncbi:MAG: hypothetical protein ACRCXB_33955 [Aeromonadaceae bacterium]
MVEHVDPFASVWAAIIAISCSQVDATSGFIAKQKYLFRDARRIKNYICVVILYKLLMQPALSDTDHGLMLMRQRYLRYGRVGLAEGGLP